jgi:hypothetical protein
MQLRIENIGPISSAQVELPGLTVIGGWNDTGKSTVGKILFAVIKAIRTRDIEYSSAQQNKIDALTSSFISTLRRTQSFIILPSIITNIVRRYIDVDVLLLDDSSSRIEDVLTEAKGKILESIFQRSINHSSNLSISETQTRINSLEESTREFIDSLRVLLTEKKDTQRMYAASFESVLRTTFRGDINNKRTNKEGKISLFHNEQDILSSSFEKNKLKHLIIEEALLGELFEDATLLESPFVLNFRTAFNTFRNSSYESPVVDYTTSDLLRKLTFATNTVTARGDSNSSTLDMRISNIIGDTIKGRIYFDQEKDDFIFLNEDKVEVKIANTASGVKTLGIIQMLAATGVLTSANLLVIDEPEVHLHPEWQLVCADVIATLVAKYNMYCVVSSHSPYFLQALEAYTKHYSVEHLAKFYLSSKRDGICSFKDITNNLEPLYDLLAVPMEKIDFLETRLPNSNNE